MLLSWITWFGLCIITKYFKGTCLVSQAESTALQEVKACSYSKQLIHKYFIFDEENGGHGSSLVVATGSRLLWDTEKRNRGRSDAFGGAEALSPVWMARGLLPRTFWCQMTENCPKHLLHVSKCLDQKRDPISHGMEQGMTRVRRR